MTNPVDMILWAAICGAFACCYHAILISPGHILSGWRKAIEGALWWIQNRTNYGWPWRVACWLTKSLVDCEYCLAGQVSVIVFLYKGGRDLIDLSLFTSAGILIGAALFSLYKHGKDQDRSTKNGRS